MNSSREQVYEAINSERDYQGLTWNAETTPSKGRHEVGAFLTYMRVYLARAEELETTLPGDSAAPLGHRFVGETRLDFVRKVVALGVICMEQHGAPIRRPPDA